jgi:hypothetical protein
MELKAVFDQIQAAERDGNLNSEEKRKLEEQAAEKGLQALFKARHTSLYCPYHTAHPYAFLRAQN